MHYTLTYITTVFRSHAKPNSEAGGKHIYTMHTVHSDIQK